MIKISETSTTAGSSPCSTLPSPLPSITDDTPKPGGGAVAQGSNIDSAVPKLDEESNFQESAVESAHNSDRPKSESHVTMTRIAAALAKDIAFEDKKVFATVASFQAGEMASDYWNGDVAAGEGHLSLMTAKHLAADPLSYSHLALNRAARKGRLDIVKWLHNYTDVPQTSGAMDAAAAGGHLEVLLMISGCKLPVTSRLCH